MTNPSDRPHRSSVILFARIDDTRNATECRVRNLSETGACVDNKAALRTGDKVRVIMGALPEMEGEVVWARNTLAGLRFDGPVDLALARRERGSGAGHSRPMMLPPSGGATQSPSPPPPPARTATSPLPQRNTAGWLDNIYNPYRR